MAMHTAQKELLKDSIIIPLTDRIFEQCSSREKVVELINEAKEGQLGREKLEKINLSQNYKF